MTLNRIRRCSQYGVLILFLFCLYMAGSRYKPYFPVDVFLRLDPLVGITAMLTGRVFIPALLLSLITLFSAVVLGRAFCGWFCPLGTTIDLFEKILYRGKHPRKRNGARSLRSLKYIILILILFSSLSGLSLGPFLDPIPLATRIYTLVFYPVIIFLANLGLDWLRPLAERLSLSSLAYLSLFQPNYAAGVITLIIFLAILALSRLESRFFCRNLCPLGALLGICSRYNLWQKQVSEACTDCQKCFQQCPTGAIEFETWQDIEAECIKCMICRDICPVNAISYPVNIIPRRAPEPGVDLSRRQVILAGASGLALALTAETGIALTRREKEILRPPGAIPEPGFLATCVRCAECIKACPTNTLQADGLTRGLHGLWAPRHQMRLAPCEQDCNLCGQVCPTGAIRNLPLEEKKFARIGTAVIIKDHCIAWEQDKACLVCDEACPYNAIIFQSRGRRGRRPVVVESRCNGCGFCENKCPVEGASAIVVRQKGEIRLSRGSYYEEAFARGLDLSAPEDEYELEQEFGEGGRGRGGSGGRGRRQRDVFEEYFE
jgi:ferredoxin-type protein NapF